MVEAWMRHGHRDNDNNGDNQMNLILFEALNWYHLHVHVQTLNAQHLIGAIGEHQTQQQWTEKIQPLQAEL
ncbi:hypothetical protein ACFODZ_03130 [Marinicella sediminis]|uniref:HIT domain-containing protein n=1 Tax=Marinicella sediminis TaxID=1792834 RepID=A0ABV7J8H0_9GAMM|nr:hypothetical protein [Marinicella sediminis]